MRYFDYLKTNEERNAAFVHFVANDYHELSHDKIRWQRDEYHKIAQQLLEQGTGEPWEPEIYMSPYDDF